MAIIGLVAVMGASCGGDDGDDVSGGSVDRTTTTTEATVDEETTTTVAGATDPATDTTLAAGSPETLASSTTVAVGPTTTARRSTATTARRATTTTTRRPTGPTTTVKPKASIPDHPEQGVSATTIKIGIMAPALIGAHDVTDFYKMHLKKWKDEGKTPVHGRNIEFVENKISGTGAANIASQRAACVQQATKDKVFYVMGTSGVYDASLCMAKEYKIPYSSAGGASPTDEDMQGSWPFLFSNNMTSSRALRNWPHWAKDRRLLAVNAKIGVFLPDNPAFREDFDRNFKSELTKLGYKIAEEAVFRDAASVPTAVQRFKSAGVEVVFMGSNPGFMPFAQEIDKQNYKPDVLMTDWDSSAITGSGSAGSGRDLPDSFRGTAMTYYHRAEDGSSSNPPLPPQAERCLDDVAKYTGKRLVVSSGGKPTADTSAASVAEHICDQSLILIDALHRAGPDLTTESLLAALEQTKDVDHGQIGPISFTATRHDGANSFKTITWDYPCDCWKYQGDFRPPWVG